MRVGDGVASAATNVIEMATRCVTAGVPVVAIIPGKKWPKEKEWNKNPIRNVDRFSEFQPGGGIGIVAGYNKREILDFDEVGLFDVFIKIVEEAVPQYVELIRSLPLTQTPRNGRHLHYLATRDVAGNTKLAMHTDLDANGKPKCRVETRGKDGQAVSFPSPGYIHISGNEYWNCPRIPDELHQLMLRVARSFDLSPKPIHRPAPIRGNETKAGDSDRPGDDYNAHGEPWAALLERNDWRYLYTVQGVQRWGRPGKDNRDVGGTLGHTGQLFYVFSSSTALDRVGAFSKFAFLCQYEYGGDYRKATRALAAQGFGKKSKRMKAEKLPRQSAAPDRCEIKDATGNQEKEEAPDAANEFGIVVPAYETPLESGSEHDVSRNLIPYISPCISDNGVLYRYKEGLWGQLSRQRIESALSIYEQGWCDKIKASGEVVTSRINMSAKHRAGCWATLLTLCTREDFFIDAPAGIVFENGFLGSDFILKPHAPENKNRSKLPYKYDEDAPHDRLDLFLLELFGSDPDAQSKIDTTQEFIGLAFMGMATKMQKSMVWLGGGANGKSTFIDIISQALFLNGSAADIDPSKWSNEYYLAQLDGVRLNFVAELPDRAFSHTGIFKAVIAGDNVTARMPRCMPFRMRPIAGHIFSCNDLPESRDASDGFWRRIMVMEFKAKFEPSALDVAAHVLNQRAGIAAWAIKGLQRVLQRGSYLKFDQAKAAELRSQADTVRMFFDESLSIIDGHRLTGYEIYAAYQRWMERNGEKHILSNTVFSTRLLAIPGVVRIRNNGARYNLIFN